LDLAKGWNPASAVRSANKKQRDKTQTTFSQSRRIWFSKQSSFLRLKRIIGQDSIQNALTTFGLSTVYELSAAHVKLQFRF
jgi:hypothetical protein